MDHYQNNGNGYSDLQQIELAIQAAQHMVGQATRSMDENQLKAANEALQQAHTQFKQALAYQNNIDEAFFAHSSALLDLTSQQLEEAENNHF
ncbi:hypothetical protein JCM19046_3726 [Bacillus sp. JCM 19046]|uniref:DUF2564 family protein n=1 Tax=Shouchella xiaoxiensis TaxID=766895 RepID=A0ABS2T0L1_9BACI|nr:DUF2564 family protein [Shouchella xiaoxiensis]MBM7840249.1 hypothetical protein [Shouchella xiaoxiensis]GAF14072.1 hypothetical protein JCM19045_3360 [Bacillus sp. JCM 19045]GAF19100.1 hypothetical protein JCM19046_3726 [Bacillus sp. JCM 19046]